MCHPCSLRLLILVKGDQRNEMFSTDMAPRFSVLKADTAVGGPVFTVIQEMDENGNALSKRAAVAVT